MLGNLPYDAATCYTPDDLVLVHEYDTDDHIIRQVRHALDSPTALIALAKRVQQKAMRQFDDTQLSAHVLSVMYPAAYSMIPPFLRHPESNGHEFYFDSTTWSGTPAFYAQLARTPCDHCTSPERQRNAGRYWTK